MEISAVLRNSGGDQKVTVRTESIERPLSIPAKDSGLGSGVNGGELLMLALATCYCNDLYREAARLGIRLDAVEVVATANFAGVGLAASDIRYWAKVSSPADAATVADLLQQTDAVAEVHNTVRTGVPVVLLKGQSGGP